jgi:Leucine-rich repeat (LRR) protein
MKTAVFILIFALAAPCTLRPQEGDAQTLTPEDIENYKRQVTDLVMYLEGTLNFIGDPKSPPREKETVIRETYLKVFKNDKVQVEDDLDENREVPLHKDVQAYLKDVDFFFRSASFKFHIVDITHFTGDDGLHFFKVTFNRDIVAKAVAGDSLNSRKIRYMEVNLDLAMNELKIASIYTTRVNEREVMRNWWNTLPEPWKNYFGRDVMLFDSIVLSDILFFEDSLILVKRQVVEPESDTVQGFDLVLPTERERSLLYRETDTLIANSQQIIGALAKILKTTEVDISEDITIRSLEPLSELSELTHVDCSNSLITSIHPLRNLNKLTTLDCSNTPVESLLSLQYSASLKKINCSYTLIDNLQPLERLVGLIWLDFSGLRVANIQFLKDLQKLEYLAMSHTRITDLEQLRSLPNLEELDVSSTPIKSLEPIAGLTKIKYLNCERTLVSSLDSLKNLTSLAGLKISHTLVQSLSQLSGMKNIKQIYWESDPLFPEEREQRRREAISFMRDNPQTLVIFEPDELVNNWKSYEQPWRDVLTATANLGSDPTKEELHAIFQIEAIHLSDTPITTLAPVKELYNLRVLDISGTQVTDFLPLSGAIELQTLNISKTSVKELGFAENLYKLKELSFEGTEVHSLDPIFDLTNLQRVYADNSGITDEVAFSFADRNPGSILIYKTSELTTWWNQLPKGWSAFLSKEFNLDPTPTREQLHELLFTDAIEIKDRQEIHSLDPVIIFKRLKSLRMGNLDVGDLNPVAGLTNLTELAFTQMPVADLTSISSLALLQSLNVMNTPVSDLRPISGLTELTSLNISGTQVSDVMDLSKLTQLESVDLSNTRIKKLKPIQGLSKLKLVKCFNTRISQKEVDRFKEANPDCQVIYY